MRPAWRLAISSLSTRRSRTFLLIGTVALSAALIAAVGAAMNSVQQSARAQVESVVGKADVFIKPSGGGRTFDAALLDAVRAWPGVAYATGWVGTPITVSARVPALRKGASGDWTPVRRVLSLTGVLTGYADPRGLESITLDAGRLPAAADEIVIDGTMAVRLSVSGAASATPFELPARTDGKRTHLTGPPPTLPDLTTDDSLAAALNAQAGVRLGDEIEVARQAMPDIDLGTLLSDPARAAELAKAAGDDSSRRLMGGLFRGETVKLRVVGIAKPPPFGGRPQAFALRETLDGITGTTGRLRQIDVVLAPGVTPDEFVAQHQGDVPEHVLVQTSTKVSSKLDQNIRASRFGMLLGTAMAFLAAGFIIATGLSTAVTERTRELGILRCIGADRGHLAASQLITGLVIGLLGACVGVPLGLGASWVIVQLLQSQIEITLAVPWWGPAIAGGGAVLCGLGAAAYPAYAASRISPLRALAIRAEAPRRAGVRKLLVIGLVCAAVQLATVTLTTDGQWRFWSYVTLGLPALFAAYFLLSVPALAGVNRAIAGSVSRVLVLPPGILGRTLAATPYRYGFTAGSMMLGMALMVGIWTQGGAVQRDYLDRMEFPDAFVTGFALSPAAQREVETIPGVTGTCAITLHPVETDAFGVRGLQQYKSMFMAFEPEPFFRMLNPLWVQGDPATAIRRLDEGGAVIVAREFMLARGLGVGDTFVCTANGREHRFEIVGVVTSPGLEVVSQFFAIGEGFVEQSLHAVFGSRRDLRERFGSDAIHLIQISIAPGADDAAIVAQVRERLAGAGILDAGSGRAVKEQIASFVKAGLFGASSIAVMTMLLAGFGVANLIIAGITARRYEFGVLEAVGASRGLVARLVLAEAVIVAVTAAILGTLMGTQGVFAVQRIDELLFGLDLKLRPPPTPILTGWAATLVMTLGAAVPAVVGLVRLRPRELLASVRG
ncbi:MAG: hypothetical protein HBSAPP03_29570 [Phycisphaerae bacterium]|nr:MAG: hypothetical protein HBSAPP03_29570 [Phycisphaerae bacterium]